MLPLVATAVWWTGVGLLLGGLLEIPYGSWIGFSVFLVHWGPLGSWKFPETPPKNKRYTTLAERFGTLGYSGSSAVCCGQGPGGLWLTRGFLDADLDHEAILQDVLAQGWRSSSRLLVLPASLRTLAARWDRYRISSGTAIDWLLGFLTSLAGALELPWRWGRPALPTELVAAAVRARGDVPPWAESFSWASPVSRLELRRLAGAAAARGWRVGEEWPVLPRPGVPARQWLPWTALVAGLAAAGATGIFGLPLLAWGLARLGLAGWLFRRSVTVEGSVTVGMSDLVSEATPFLDDGERRLQLVGFAPEGEFQARGWQQGDRIVLGGLFRYLGASLVATLFGISLTTLWWMGV